MDAHASAGRTARPGGTGRPGVQKGHTWAATLLRGSCTHSCYTRQPRPRSAHTGVEVLLTPPGGPVWLGLGCGAVGSVWPVYTVTAGSWTSTGGLQRQEDPHGWSDAETSSGEHVGTSVGGGEAWGPKQRAQGLRGQWGQEPRAPGARWGAERVGPVRSTGQSSQLLGGWVSRCSTQDFRGPQTQ